jgi:hypothetical protein
MIDIQVPFITLEIARAREMANEIGQVRDPAEIEARLRGLLFMWMATQCDNNSAFADEFIECCFDMAGIVLGRVLINRDW